MTTTHSISALMGMIRNTSEFHAFRRARVGARYTGNAFLYANGKASIRATSDDLLPYSVLRRGDGRWRGFPNITTAEVDVFAHLVNAGELPALAGTVNLAAAYCSLADVRETPHRNHNPHNYLRMGSLGRRIQDILGNLTDHLLDNVGDDEGFEAVPEIDDARSALMALEAEHGLFDRYDGTCPCCESTNVKGSNPSHACEDCGATWTTRPYIVELGVSSHIEYPHRERRATAA